MIALFVMPSVAAGPLDSVDDIDPTATVDGVIGKVVFDSLVIAVLTLRATGCSSNTVLDSGRVPHECIDEYQSDVQGVLGRWIQVHPES